MSDTTKRALSQALKKELAKKPLSKITISDITKACGVNRMTFYYHFHDIYDLIDWTFHDELYEPMGSEQYTEETFRNGVTAVIKRIQSNKSFVMNVYRSVGREKVETYLYKSLFPVVSHFIEKELQGVPVPPDDKKFYTDFYVYAFSGVIQHWMSYDMKEDPNVLIERMELLCQGNLDSVRNSYEKNS